MRNSIAYSVAVLLLTVACGAGGPGPTAAPPTSPPSREPTATPTPSTSPIGDANLAVVRIEQTGGMLPPWMTLSYYPTVALYGDGKLIMEGPQIEIYPGPALPSLVVTRLTQVGVEQILAWAQEAGLHGPDRQLGPMILDSGQTLFTIVSPAGTHQTGITDISASDPEIGAAREFMEILQSIRAWLAEDVVGDEEPYAFERLRLISSVADPANGDIEPSGTIAWPLDEPLATIGQSMSEPPDYRCSLIEGEDLQTLMPLFQQANELTRWQSDTEDYQLVLRPLLPDEEACPGF